MVRRQQEEILPVLQERRETSLEPGFLPGWDLKSEEPIPINKPFDTGWIRYVLLYLTLLCIAGSWNILSIITGFPTVLLRFVFGVGYCKNFHECCCAVHEVLSTLANHVCDSIPDEFEPARGRTKRSRRKRKRTSRWQYKLTNYYQLKFTRGRNRRGWNKLYRKEPKEKKDRQLEWLINHPGGPG